MSRQTPTVTEINATSPSSLWWAETEEIVATHVMNALNGSNLVEGHPSPLANVAEVADEATENLEEAGDNPAPHCNAAEAADGAAEDFDPISANNLINELDAPAVMRIPVPFIRRIPATSGALESIPTRLTGIVTSLVSASLNTPHPFVLPETQLIIKLDNNTPLGPIYDRVLTIEANCRECLRRLSWEALNQEIRRLSARYDAVLQALFGAHQLFWALLREQSSQGKRINHGLLEWGRITHAENHNQMRETEGERLYWESRESTSRNALMCAWNTCGNLMSQYVGLCHEVTSFYSRVESVQLQAESYFLNICSELSIQEEFVPSSPE